MSKFVKVKPAGNPVPFPVVGFPVVRPMAKLSGEMEVDLFAHGAYWLRRLNKGEVVLVEKKPEKKADKPPKKKGRD